MNDKNIEEKATKTVKERVLEYERFKESVIEYLSKRDNPDQIVMYIGEKGYTPNGLVSAITEGSEDGLHMISNLFILTIDLLVRDNQEINKKYSLLSTFTQYKEVLKLIVQGIEVFNLKMAKVTLEGS